MNPPAESGMPVQAVDTPALLLDLDAFEFNLDALDRSLAGRTVRVRPHAKSHKCAAIARAQMARGAVGVCCQKVSEAEALVDGGVGNVLVSNEIIGERKLARLAALAGRAQLGVLVDDPQGVATLAAAVAAAGTRLDVYVEVDVGAGRCGVAPGEPAAALAALVARQPGLHFAGLHAYQGAAQHLRTQETRAAAIDTAVVGVRATQAALAAAGLHAAVVTGAGTGTYPLEASSGVYTEIQPGSYVFMDADYQRNLDAGGAPLSTFRQSLHLLATVMSRPQPGRAVVDVGLKAHSVDSGMPLVADIAGARYTRASDEHGVVELAPGTELPLGARLRLVPGHCDPTVNLHEWIVGVRGGMVECVWPVDARGAFF